MNRLEFMHRDDPFSSGRVVALMTAADPLQPPIRRRSMTDLLVGLGMVFVIEGLLWALAPGLGARLLQAMAQAPETTVRTAGAVAVAIGVFIVWLARG